VWREGVVRKDTEVGDESVLNKDFVLSSLPFSLSLSLSLSRSYSILLVAIPKYLRLGLYKEQIYLAHSFGGWKSNQHGTSQTRVPWLHHIMDEGIMVEVPARGGITWWDRKPQRDRRGQSCFVFVLFFKNSFKRISQDSMRTTLISYKGNTPNTLHLLQLPPPLNVTTVGTKLVTYEPLGSKPHLHADQSSDFFHQIYHL
jgi:hypothetical protein